MAQAIGEHGSGHGLFRVTASFDAGPITVAERWFPAGYREGTHAHHVPYFSVLLEGTIIERDGSHEHISEGPCLGYEPIGEHSSHVPVDAKAIIVTLWDSVELPSHPCSLRSGPLLTLASSLREEVMVSDEHSALHTEAIVGEMVAVASRTKLECGKSWISRADELLRTRCTEPMSLDAIAGQIGAHPVSLARAYRRAYGMTVGEAQRRYRIERACGLMRKRLPLGEIAAECGFADQSHLGRVFRKVTRQTPASFRDRLMG